jgi:hypothetical protein
MHTKWKGSRRPSESSLVLGIVVVLAALFPLPYHRGTNEFSGISFQTDFDRNSKELAQL